MVSFVENGIHLIWKSDLPRNIKVEFFRATVESVLLYGGETWTLTKSLEQRLDGCYTRLLRAALNISWRQHTTNKELYGDLPRVSTTLRERRLRFSGHCWRSKAEVIPKLLFWQPTQGRRSRGRPAQTYIDQMERDTGLLRTEIPTVMEDRKEWKDLILNVRARSIE